MTAERSHIGILGCGWSGLPLARTLIEHGYRVTGSTTTSAKRPAIEAVGATAVMLHATPEMTAEAAKDICAVDALVITLPPPRPPENDSRDRATYARKVHEAIVAAANAHGVPRLVVYSSTSVYDATPGPKHEEDAQKLTSKHTGIAMLELEEVYKRFNGEVNILRFGGLYGPDRAPGKFIIRRGSFPGNLSEPVNMTHLEDVISATQYSLEGELQTGVYNVVSPEHPSRGAFYHAALRALGENPDAYGIIGNAEVDTSARIVSSDKLLAAGYRFKEPNPLFALMKK